MFLLKEFLVVSTLFYLNCPSCTSANRNELFEHKSRVAKFKCGEPQARAVPLEEIFVGEDLSAVRVLPHITVLHRCENAGCCNVVQETCQPDDSEDIKLVFRFNYVKGHEIRTKMAKNHTSCLCQNKQNTPK